MGSATIRFVGEDTLARCDGGAGPAESIAYQVGGMVLATDGFCSMVSAFAGVGGIGSATSRVGGMGSVNVLISL